MKKSINESSNYLDRNHTYTAKDMENMW